MGEMRVLDPSGDSKIIWDPDNDDEVEGAEAQFDILVDKGFKAYKVGKDHKKTGKPLKKFSPSAGKIIMVPAIAGG